MNGENQLRPKTATTSFRLEASVLDALREDAKRQNLSINTLLNQILLTYTNYDRPMKRFRMLKLPASAFKRILEAAPDEAIIEAGRSTGRDVPETYIRARWGELTLENALSFLKITGEYSNRFEYSEIVHDGKISVTLTHDFGTKGNLFFQSFVKAIFHQMGASPRFTSGTNAVTFELR
jgi:hypothetical protein